MHKRTGMTAAAALVLSGLTALAALAGPTKTGEWPQWRGPDRTGVSKETGLLQSWPQGGPKLLWKAENLGYGWSTPSVAGGRVYGMSLRGDQEVVWAVDASGKELWAAPISKPVEPDPNNRGAGPRGAPTVDGNRVYALGVNGDLACLGTDGKLVWKKSLTGDFGGVMPKWGYSESPLVDREKLIATPGGPNAAVVALNKNTGATVWQCAVPGGDRAEYSSAIVADMQGQRQYIQFLKGGVVGISADGQFLWKFPHAAGNTANVPTPIYRDNHVFAAAGYGKGAALGKLTRGPNGWTAEQVYHTNAMINHHGGVVLVGDHLYGIHDGAGLSCLDFKTGDVKWSERSVGKGSLVYADNRLYARKESTGQMTLAEATPKGYVEKGRFDPPRDPNQPTARPADMAWAHPVVAGGRLYLRDQNWLLCYDVSRQ